MRPILLIVALLVSSAPAQAQGGRTHEEWQAIRTAWFDSIRGPYIPNTIPYARWPSYDLPPPPHPGPRSPIECDVLLTDDPEYPFISRFPPETPLYHNLDLENAIIDDCDFRQRVNFFDINLDNVYWTASYAPHISLLAGFIENSHFDANNNTSTLGFGILNITNSAIDALNTAIGFGDVVFNNSSFIFNATNKRASFFQSEIINSNLDISNSGEPSIGLTNIVNTTAWIDARDYFHFSATTISGSEISATSRTIALVRNLSIEDTEIIFIFSGDGKIENLNMLRSRISGHISGNFDVTELNLADTDLSGLIMEVDSLSLGDEFFGNYYCISDPPRFSVRTHQGELEAQPIPAEPRDC